MLEDPPEAQTIPDVPGDSRRGDLDQMLGELVEHRDEWAALPIADRRAILRELRRDFTHVSDRWADAGRAAKGLPAGRPVAGEEWLAGSYFILRNLRLLEESLADIENDGRPEIPGRVSTRDGQVRAQIFPQSVYDRVLYSGVTAEVRMHKGVTEDSLPETQAVAYRGEPSGAVALVLGAGNVSSIGPMDVLYKLFVENRVVICKMHPVNAYLGPILAEGFQALIDWGVLRIAYGGADVGAYLCEHAAVDEIHITGSDKTVEAIVFGPGEEGGKRKRERRPRLDKPISSELGNVSPVIVVPGPWTDGDLAFHGENLAAMVINNAGFNCNAVRVIVQHSGWQQRGDLLEAMRRHLGQAPTRPAYYPGAEDRHRRFVKAHPDAERHGLPDSDELPWTLIAGVDPTAKGDICFDTEAFCGLACETALDADSTAEFLERAVAFANDTLWGTLNVTLIVHPKTLEDPELRAAVEGAIDDLRFGTVSINSWAAVGYGLVVSPWGAYPGHDIYDIQSGTGVVHNTLMFDRVEKTVVRSPFRVFPKPPWFPSHRRALALARKLTELEAAPSPLRLPGLFWEALRG